MMKITISLIVFLGVTTNFIRSASAGPGPDTWNSQQIIEPEKLAQTLSDKKSSKPLLIHVGFQFLYKNAHLAGSKYTGAGSEAVGIDGLKKELQNVSRDREIILYCGCCPLKRCPNLRPAFKAVLDMGFTKAKILHLPDSLDKNWTEKGYAIEKSAH